MKEPGGKQGSEILVRWLKVQGLDIGPRRRFSRADTHEIIGGDAQIATKVRFVSTAKSDYRLVVECRMERSSVRSRLARMATGTQRNAGTRKIVWRERTCPELRRLRFDANSVRREFQSGGHGLRERAARSSTWWR
jgi:hypothetical protein